MTIEAGRAEFAGPLEFGDERHGHGPDSGEDHADGDDARQKQALVNDRHVAAAHHDPSEDKHEQQRL